jgi:hypothetical protein
MDRRERECRLPDECSAAWFVVMNLLRLVLVSASMTASASSSTSQSGSMNRETCMIVFAGRIAPKNSPCTAATACQSSILVSSVRVRTT